MDDRVFIILQGEENSRKCGYCKLENNDIRIYAKNLENQNNCEAIVTIGKKELKFIFDITKNEQEFNFLNVNQWKIYKGKEFKCVIYNEFGILVKGMSIY